MALTSLSALKTHLGITGSTQDDFLSQLLEAVESAFLKLVDRIIEETTETFYLDGNNSAVITLPEYPVSSVSDVRVDPQGFYGQGASAFAASTALTAGVDYCLVKDSSTGTAEVGRLFRIGNVWPGRWEHREGLLTPLQKRGAGNIKVTATFGYSTVPADIALAIWQVVAQLRSARKYGRPVDSERFEDYSYHLEADALTQWRLGNPAQIVAEHTRITPKHGILG